VLPDKSGDLRGGIVQVLVELTKVAATATTSREFEALGMELPRFRRRSCNRWAGIRDRPLDRCPYLLLGSTHQMAEALIDRREVHGLDRSLVTANADIAAAPLDPLRLGPAGLPLPRAGGGGWVNVR
jgi:hypothetical protein